MRVIYIRAYFGTPLVCCREVYFLTCTDKVDIIKKSAIIFDQDVRATDDRTTNFYRSLNNLKNI